MLLKNVGFKGSYTSFAKKIYGAVEKPAYTFPGFGGSGIDSRKQTGKIPKRKKGQTLPGHRYAGPYDDLENHVRYDPETGEILEMYDPPTGRTDAIAMQHDVDYSDRKIVKSLDAIPYKDRQWGRWFATSIISTKQKIGLGLN